MFEFEYSIKNKETPVAYASFKAMHTVMEVIITSIKEEEFARKTCNYLYEIVTELETLFNRFDLNSTIGRLNARKSPNTIALDEKTYMILELCDIFRKETKGYFDVTIQSEYKNDIPQNPYKLNPSEKSISFNNRYTILDLGGIAKGFTLELTKQALLSENINNALINFGNSSVLAIGSHPYGSYWPVGVEHTLQTGYAAHSFKLSDSSLSVSGLTPKGEKHIKNPLTKEYVSKNELIAVEGKSPLITEVLSTALYACPIHIRKQILANFDGYSAYTINCQAGGETIAQLI